MIKVARTFHKKLNFFLQTSGLPTPSPTDMDSRSDSNKTATHAGARWAIGFCCPISYWLLPHSFPCTSVNCAPDTTVTEADPTFPEIPVPVSPPILNRSSEPQSMVSIILIPLTAVTNYSLLRMSRRSIWIQGLITIWRRHIQEQGEGQIPVVLCFTDYSFPRTSIVAEEDPMLAEISVPASPPILDTSSDLPSMVSITFISLTVVTNYCPLSMCCFQALIASALSSIVPSMYTCTSRQLSQPLM